MTLLVWNYKTMKITIKKLKRLIKEAPGPARRKPNFMQNPLRGSNNNVPQSPELLSRELELAIDGGQRKLDAFIDKVEAINPGLVDGMWIQYADDAILTRKAEDRGRDTDEYSGTYVDMAIEDFEENYQEVMK